MVTLENKTENQNLIIVKVGSNTAVDREGNIRTEIVRDVVETLQKVIKQGTRVVLITSGAVRIGRSLAGDDAEATLAASLGQPVLFNAYHEEAKKVKLPVAEFLLTRPYIVTREYFLGLQNTLSSLLDRGILPIINENDALVAYTQWSFGDNDSLGAALSISLKASRFVILSHIEGLFDADPTKNKNAKLIKKVNDINSELLRYCSPDASVGGRGGMLSKLKAARLVTAFGVEAQIISGLEKGNLAKALRGEEIGTILSARQSDAVISNRDRWILAAKNSAGSIEVDDGAVKALKEGKSLLAVGVKKIHGEFDKKEIVEVVDSLRQGIACGIVDYSSHEIEGILHAENLKDVQLIHTDNMISLQ